MHHMTSFQFCKFSNLQSFISQQQLRVWELQFGFQFIKFNDILVSSIVLVYSAYLDTCIFLHTSVYLLHSSLLLVNGECQEIHKFDHRLNFVHFLVHYHNNSYKITQFCVLSYQVQHALWSTFQVHKLAEIQRFMCVSRPAQASKLQRPGSNGRKRLYVNMAVITRIFIRYGCMAVKKAILVRYVNDGYPGRIPSEGRC